jgi:exodeoxyribonuclease V alpha subunit
MEKLKGNPIRILQRSATGDWAVVLLKVTSDGFYKGKEVKVVGNIPAAEKDDELELNGEWDILNKFGKQFKVITAYRLEPTTQDQLVKFLAKHTSFKGIGPKTAQAIVDKFGYPGVKDVLEKTPEKLAEIKGIGITTAIRAGNAWVKLKECGNTEIIQLQMYLAQHKLGTNWAAAMVKTFGSGKSMNILKSNPYKLMEVPGIGFLKADEMAIALGWPIKSPERTEACFTDILNKDNEQGDVFSYEGELIEKAKKVAGETEEIVRQALDKVISRGELKVEVVGNPDQQLKLLYLPRLLKAEKEVARQVKELLSYPHALHQKTHAYIEEVSLGTHVTFTDKQKEGIAAPFLNHISVITGGPGTGKTTIVKAIVSVAERLGLDIKLAAPTGRAARRLSELADHKAETIHRMIGMSKTDILHDKSNPISCDLLLIDEASMLEIELAYHLFDAIPIHCSVVFVGDTDQLPAIGGGTVLRDFIKSKKIPIITLDQIFRQAEGSLMIENSYKIKQGLLPSFAAKGTKADSYFMSVPKVKSQAGKSVDDTEWVQTQIANLVTNHIPNKFNVDPIKDIQVLAPMRRGVSGISALNDTLQDVLNPSGETFIVRGKKFRVGDRVMQNLNDYTLNVFNGDIGFITRVEEDDGKMYVDFYGTEVEYGFELGGNLELAYAQTIHKSQGSEYPIVIIVLLMQHWGMLQRNLLYTANTRATNMVLYVAAPGAIKRAVEQHEVINRNTFLSQRLRQ